MRQRQRIRRSRTYSLDALIVADDGDVDDPIAELLQQARERGLPLAVAGDSPDIPVGPPDAADAAVGDVATPPPALGSSGASTRAIQHPSSRVAEKVGPSVKVDKVAV
jgi:hypothetical protein